MEFDPNKSDISFQFGRLLAVLEKVERDTYDREETREPNAIRLQSVYCNRPMKTFQQIYECLNQAYFPKLKPWLREYYRAMITNIIAKIDALSEIDRSGKSKWKAPLNEMYLIGYFLQRKELYTKKEKPENKEENAV